MPSVDQDVLLAELALLDVIDVRLDGSLALNREFVAELMQAFDEDPGSLATVVQGCIMERAAARGYWACVDVDDMALAALELGATEETTA